jgi:F0F1-type ATP synthase membrane subunit b/b'
MKYIFKHPEKIEISEIADNEANKMTTLLFKIHKTFCNKCRNIFHGYKTLGTKLNEVYDKQLISTTSDRVYNFYSKTLKVAVYALIVGVTLSSVGIAFAQTQTDVDIIPDVTFLENGELISFSDEEVENFFTELIDPIQATLITFIEPDQITVEEITTEIDQQVDVLTTLVVDEEPVVVDEEPVVVDEEPVVVDEEPVVVDEEPVVVDEEPVVVDEEPVVVDEEPVVVDEVIETEGLQNALSQIEKNIALAIENNNLDALNGLENARSKIIKNIEKAEDKLQEGEIKAEEKLQEGNKKAQKEIEEAKDKAEKILSKVKTNADEKEVVKAQLKAERTLEKAQEKAEEELEKAQVKAQEEVEKAQKEAEKEAEKAEKEAEKAVKEAEKASKKDK